ncbi:AAA family ATPase [Streptomyces sp. AD2-2]|nr:AAA family ATPase [Streptomyces sp. AD2-2]
MAVLGDHVLDALDGGSHLTAVLGELGVGKTELVEELAVRLHELLQEVVWGRCTSGEGVPAYWVWAQVFRQLAVSRPEAFRKAEARFGSLLAPLMLDPESGRRSLSGEDPSARARFLTQDAMCETLLSLAAEDPLVVVLEDLDQADESSLELLALLRTRLHCEPLSVVVTADDTGAAADLMGGGAVAEALGDSRTRSVRLTGLSRRETGDLVSAQTAVEVPDEVLRLLHERSRGNPYVLHQFIAGVGDPGLLSDRAVVESALADIPVGVRQAVGRRLAALPGPVLDVLRCCSALGGAFELALVREVLGGSTDVEAAIEAATRHGLLRRAAQPLSSSPSATNSSRRSSSANSAAPTAPDSARAWSGPWPSAPPRCTASTNPAVSGRGARLDGTRRLGTRRVLAGLRLCLHIRLDGGGAGAW